MGGKGSGRREQRRTQQTGLLGVVLATDLPTRVIGVQQRGGGRVPDTCPKCRQGAPDWAVNEWEGHCRCGEDFFRLIGEIRFHAHRQRQPVYAGESA